MPSISNSMGEKPSISIFSIWNTRFFDRNTRFSIEILDSLFEILSFSFDILGILKEVENCIP